MHILPITKDALAPFISFGVDTALSPRSRTEVPKDLSKVRLVGWLCGHEPLVVAVWSYLDVTVKAGEAKELAIDLLQERDWFADPTRTEPDFVL